MQPIKSKKKKSDTDSKQREKKETINIVDTPKKLVWSFTVLFLGEKEVIITSKHAGTTIIFLNYSLTSIIWIRSPGQIIESPDNQKYQY